jgi:hypothetical protein
MWQMPWHVIVNHNKAKPEDPFPLVDRIFRKEDYPGRKQMLAAVSTAREDLKAKYPPPDYTVVSGRGPEPDSPAFGSFVVWLLRDE